MTSATKKEVHSIATIEVATITELLEKIKNAIKEAQELFNNTKSEVCREVRSIFERNKQLLDGVHPKQSKEERNESINLHTKRVLQQKSLKFQKIQHVINVLRKSESELEELLLKLNND